MRQCEQPGQAAQGLAPALLGTRRGVGPFGLVHQGQNQQPGQHAQQRQDDKTRAPAPVLHHPGQRRAGEHQAQAPQAQAQAREEGKALAGEMARDEDGAGQKGRRAAHADHDLPQHQPAMAGRQGRQRGPGDGHRGRGQHRGAQAVAVHGDAHEQLRHTEGQAEQPGKRAQRLGRQAKVLLQALGHDGGDGAVGLAERKTRQQGQQHEPEWAGRVGCGGGSHIKFYSALRL